MFLFTDGLRVVGEPDSEISHLVDELIAAGIVVGDCSINWISGTRQMWPRATGIKAELPRDAVSRLFATAYPSALSEEEARCSFWDMPKAGE